MGPITCKLLPTKKERTEKAKVFSSQLPHNNTVYLLVVKLWCHSCHNQVATHNDTVFLVALQADSGDVRGIGTSQQTEKAGLTVLMAGEQLPVRHNQTTWDTRGRGHTLGDDLEERSIVQSIMLHSSQAVM